MNSLFEIKVCGINDEISMNTAHKCKVDYVGLVFYPNSPRHISINLSRELVKSRNKTTKIVALTVDPKDDFLNEIKTMMGSPNEPTTGKAINIYLFNFNSLNK